MLAACMLTVAVPALAAAQGREHAFSTPPHVIPSVADVTGSVIDDAGGGVPGVAVLAIGPSLATVRTTIGVTSPCALPLARACPASRS